MLNPYLKKIKNFLSQSKRQRTDAANDKLLQTMITAKQYPELFQFLEKALKQNDIRTYALITSYKARNIKLSSEEDCMAFLKCLRLVTKLIKTNSQIDIYPLLEILLYGDKDVKFKEDFLGEVIALTKEVYHNLSDRNKGPALQFMCIFHRGQPEAFDFFIERLLDQSDEAPDSMEGYNSIKALEAVTSQEAEQFLKNFENFNYNLDSFRSIALIELFSSWVHAHKISSHPLKKHLNLVADYLDYPEARCSYLVSIIFALALIKTDQSVEILKKALNHNFIDVRLEACYARVLHGVPEALNDFLVFLKDPTISEKAQSYIEDMENDLSIEVTQAKTLIKTLKCDEEFIAKSSLSSWLSHVREYGLTPDEIEIKFATKYLSEDTPPTEHMVYFINYKYFKKNKDFENYTPEGMGCVIIFDEEGGKCGWPYSNAEKYNSLEEAMEGYEEFIAENI